MQGTHDYFLNVSRNHSGVGTGTEKSGSPDYRKHDDSVYGVVEFYGHEEADTRIGNYRQILHNLYYYGRDVLPKQQWLDLKQTKQITPGQVSEDGSSSWNPLSSLLSQGSINLASPKHSQFLTSFTKYNLYLKHHIISLRTDNS